MDFEETAAKIKVLFWNAPQAEYVKGSSSVLLTAEINPDDIGVSFNVGDVPYNENCVFLRSPGIPAKSIGETIYARAYIEGEDGSVLCYSEVSKYSVLRYVYDRFEDEAENPAAVTDEQMELYRNILRYGGVAQKVFDYNTDRLATDKFVDVIVEGGRLTDGFTRGLYAVGESYQLVAPLTSGDETFCHWEDDKGNKYDDAYHVFTVDAESMNVTYTAVYGNPANVTVVGGTGSGEYVEGEEFTITANEPAENYAFLHWTDGAGTVIGTDPTMTLTVAAGAQTYTAHYAAPTTVTVSGGTVNLGHVTDGTSATTLTVAPGETYAVTAVAPEGKQFSAWADGRKAAAFSLTAVADSETPVSVSFTATFADSDEAYLIGALGEDAAAKFAELTAILSGTDIYEWLVDLYDPETGAFYYSISARDYYGFLPDLESSEHALGLTRLVGLYKLGENRSICLTVEQQAKYTSWLQSLQSSVDGRFYHPQWGTNVNNARSGRDVGNGMGALYNYGYLGGSTVLFDNTDYGKTGSAEPITLPLTTSTASAVSGLIAASIDASVQANRWNSAAAFVEYLEAELVNRNGNFYDLGNYVASEATAIDSKPEIKAACIQWFSSKQLSNGLWTDGKTNEATYETVSALMKIGALYNRLGAEIPKAATAFNNALDVALSATTATQIVYVYNPLYAMSDLITNVTKYGSDKTVLDNALSALRTNDEAKVELIVTTATKLNGFKKSDGGFSYQIGNSITDSQGVPVSLGLAESDANATTIALQTREFLLTVLGAKAIMPLPSYVGAIYVDKADYDIVKLENGTWRDSVGNAVAAENVMAASHADRFKGLLSLKTESDPKSEPANEQNLTMTFDGTNDEVESGRYVGTRSNATVDEGKLKVTDSNSTWDGVYFIPIEQDGWERYYEFGYDVKYENITSGENLSQVYFDKAQVTVTLHCTNSKISFKNISMNNASGVTLFDGATVNANEQFNINIKVYPGKPIDGSETVALVTVTQGATVLTDEIKYYVAAQDPASTGKMPFEKAYIHGYTSAGYTMYLDNVICIEHNANLLNPDGDYNFDREDVPGSYSGGTVIDDTYKTTTDNVYSVAPGATASLTAKDYTGTFVQANFNHTEMKFRASGYSAGDEVATVALTDASSNVILVVKLVATAQGVFNLTSLDGTITLLDNLTANAGEWIQLRIDYYYDSGRVDFVARYNDRTVDAVNYPNGLYETVGATCTNVTAGTTASSFAQVEVTAASGVTVELDDVYVRNVTKPATN